MTVAVIGAGAAGLMAAGAAAEAGARVLLFDKNAKAGRKIMITGKGRCNVTNNCDVQTVLANVPVNPRFLYSALGRYSPADTMAFFEAHGVPLKTERGERVFPVSDKALDIVDALYYYVKDLGVQLLFGQAVEDVLTANGAVCGVRAAGRDYPADRVIIATGARPIRPPARPATAMFSPSAWGTRSCRPGPRSCRWSRGAMCAESSWVCRSKTCA